MCKRFWISDNGDVLCDEHTGAYLRSAIEAKPKAWSHVTPLDNWSLYFSDLIGGADLVCETCVPWNSPDHPYNKLKEGQA